MTERRGFVAIPRDRFDPEAPTRAGRPIDLFGASLDCWSLAVFKPITRLTKAGPVGLDMGQFVASHSYLARRWNVSEKTVRTYLKYLETVGEIDRGSVTQAGTIYTVVAYRDAQPASHLNGRPNGRPDGRARGGRRTIQYQAVTGH